MIAIIKEVPNFNDLMDFWYSPEGIVRSINYFGRNLMPEHYQIELIKSQGYTLWNKSRQIGWSFGAAMKSLARSLTIRGKTGIFISINQDESKEKIRYINDLEEGLPLKWHRKRITDSKSEVEWADGSRVISHPARPSRGKPNADIYFDEFAHVRDDRNIYIGSTASTIRSTGGGLSGNVDIGSTPFGTRGLFWEIDKEVYKKYSTYKRYYIPWWCCSYLTVSLKEAAKIAPFMTTEERVELFGTEPLKAQLELLGIEAFQQEFECAYVEASSSLFSTDLIIANTDESLRYENLVIRKPRTDGEILSARLAIEKAIGEAQSLLVGETVLAGFDVGRHRDSSELIVVEKMGNQFFVRLVITLDQVEFDVQEFCLRRLMESPRIGRLCIDMNGIGEQLAETMHKAFGTRVEPIRFALQSKELMASGMLKTMQQRRWHLPLDRDLHLQLNAIKRVVTPTGNVRYDVEANEKHHGDKAWAIMLANLADSEFKFAIGTIDFRTKAASTDGLPPVLKDTPEERAQAIARWRERKTLELTEDEDEGW